GRAGAQDLDAGEVETAAAGPGDDGAGERGAAPADGRSCRMWADSHVAVEREGAGARAPAQGEGGHFVRRRERSVEGADRARAQLGRGVAAEGHDLDLGEAFIGGWGLELAGLAELSERAHEAGAARRAQNLRLRERTELVQQAQAQV